MVGNLIQCSWILIFFYIGFVTDVASSKCRRQVKRMLLFTPGPVSTDLSVRDMMSVDYSIVGSETTDTITYLREAVLEVDDLPKDKFTTIILQGSGTFSIEGAINTATPIGGTVLVITNGHFGEEIVAVCKRNRIDHHVLQFPDGKITDPATVENYLRSKNNYSTIVMVHHETSLGVLNPLLEIGKLVQKYAPEAHFVVDAVSSFGCYPIPMEEAGIDFMIATPNKCIEGIAVFGITIARKNVLLGAKDNYRSKVLDLVDEYESLENENTQRYTFPILLYRASKKAMQLYMIEGREQRMKRYAANNRIIRTGMRDLGFQEFLEPDTPNTVMVTVYIWPTNPNFDFDFFVKSLESKNMIIYPVSLTETQVFRIGNIGQLTEKDCHLFIKEVKNIMQRMNVQDPNPV